MSTLVQAAPGAGLDAFFKADGVAVIGASEDITKIGGRPVQLLRKYGYAGAIYPVNPKGGTVQGLQAYASVLDTPTAPELAIVAVPAPATLQAVRECARRGVRGVVVLSTGFAESGPEGAALQAELVNVARAHGMRLLGPNCLGAVNVVDKVVASFSIALEQSLPPAGQVGIVSQSGNIGSFTMRNMAERGMGVSRFIATGNEADVDVADGIAALASDAGTRIILCCMETCRDAGRLVEALDMARRQHKPVIVLKIGATAQGQAAAASHTGALMGSDAVFDAVFRRHGVLRVRSFEELLDVGHAAVLIGAQRLPATDAVTLVAASGGFGIMMADAMVQAGMTLPPLAERTRARIREAVPTAGTNNPVDASAQMSARPDILLKMLSALQEDANGSTLVLLLALSLYNPRLRGVYLEALSKVRASHPDRLLVIISQGPADAVAEINALGIPVFPSIPAAATGLAGLVRLGQLASLAAAPTYTGPVDRVDAAVFRNELHAKKALQAAGISVPREEVVASADEAVRSARATGYPVVLKIASEDISHKTEIGGVALGLKDDDAVRQAYGRLMDNARQHAPRARLDGVLVAPMASGGVELIAGVSRDPVFGPVVMVGFGGIYAEILKDVAVQVAPVSEDEAMRMIRGLRMFPLLDGPRGQPKADVAAAARTVARLSEFACRHAADVADIDLNPILVRPRGEGVLVLDALMVANPGSRAAH
ncbi:acetate--CoA ligase family protein [Variovorax sp. J22G73]|uniref:acetate--CoA ligase family protein n=1 Tax=unclassified Variovorax TaxID=663243 RepID=UPI0025764AF3|nr:MULTISPECIES: acetate--CoA ligase family protein [unclassified Variovorax]MDM0010474.1 acetate--CoA ligase family protein [Variovorax sp. J22R203]MDM0102943.1 acetate--CoA ligase family protein [Variovorax sp. J22G73]